MREDRFTNTEHDAGLYEARRGQSDDVDDRPTRGEAERDACKHLHQSDTADLDANLIAEAIWVCDDCGEVLSGY